MDTLKAARILETGRDCGADFTEIFVEETRHSSITYSDKKVETATAGTDFGIGIRLIFGTDVLYASTSNEDIEYLIGLVKKLSTTREIKNSNSICRLPEKSDRISGQKILLDPRTVSQSRKLPLLKLADDAARGLSERVVQVNIRAFDSVSDISIINSEGLFLQDHRVHSRFTLSVTASNGKEIYTGTETPGEGRGFEFFESLKPFDLAIRAGERALRMLDAGYIKGKKMPVVMGNGFGGVIFHEACGHPLETEAIRKKSSPLSGNSVQKSGRNVLQPSMMAQYPIPGVVSMWMMRELYPRKPY